MNIIWKIRLPRVLMAGILGGALALSGFLLQTFFSNPIAGPYVLGISSGAKMMVALAMIIFLKYYTLVSSYILIIAAFIGSMLSIGFILLLARKIRNMATLLVGGIMIGYICSAVTDFVVTFAEDSDIVNLHGWSQGSFSGMSWSNVKVAALMVGITLILTFFKHLLGTAKPLVVIPATFLGGAVFCMGCDLIARMAFAPLELNISTVTSIFGAPIVIFMMIKGRKGK